MSNNVKITSPWSQLAIFLGLLGGALLVTLMVSGVILIAREGVNNIQPDLNLDNPRMTGTLKWIQAVSTILIFGIPSLVYARLTFRRQPLYYLGWRPADKWVFYILGVLLLMAAFPVEGWLGQINRYAHLPDWAIKMEKDTDRQITAFLKVNSPVDIFINLLVIAVLPAIFEELCFRGTLQRILIQIFRNPWVGILVTAIFFSAFHLQFQGFLPRFFLGILLGAAYWYSGSLWVSILAHFFVNGVQVVAVTYYPTFVDKDPSVPVVLACISLIIVVGLLLRIRKLSVRTYDSVYQEEIH